MTYLIITILIFFSALFSGLTIGLLGLNNSELQRKIKLGNKKALKIFEVRKNGNFLLTVLLLGNVFVNSVLSVYLGNEVGSGVVAVLVSTALIVIFGEIIPQAIFYRHAMAAGYYFIPIVKIFSFLLFPIAWPISKVLDKVLGKEDETIWSKKEIKEIIKVHEDSSDSDIDADEERVVLGALSYSEKKVKSIMTPKNKVFSLDVNDILTEKVLAKIKNMGHSRIPIFEDDIDKIVGVLNVKSLILVNTDSNKKVYDLYNHRNIIEVSENENLDTVLNKFINKKVHIAYVVNTHKTFLGIITMEDIIEEILKKEIFDETDKK